jgi:peptidoglycan/xylan/chitin deacetylase (PgdA/CDA1 family)
MQKKILIVISIFMIVTLLGFISLKIVKSREFQLFGTIIDRVETKERVLALTFDDGPVAITEDIVDYLATYNIKATFFVVGENLEKNLKSTEYAVSYGHQIANHSFSHNRLIFKSPSYIEEQITKTTTLIRKSGFTEEILFRAPFNSKFIVLPYVLSKFNMLSISSSIFSFDYVETDYKKIASNILSSVKSGGIISLHDREASLKALKIVVPKLLSDGYKFKTINELISTIDIKRF